MVRAVRIVKELFRIILNYVPQLSVFFSELLKKYKMQYANTIFDLVDLWLQNVILHIK